MVSSAVTGSSSGDFHRGTGGDAVVDDHDPTTTSSRVRPMRPVEVGGVREPQPLPGFDRLHGIGLDSQVPDHFLVQDSEIALGNRADRQLRLSGRSKFSHQENVQRTFKLPRDFESNRHAPSGQTNGQIEGVLNLTSYLGGEKSPRFGTIEKEVVSNTRERK